MATHSSIFAWEIPWMEEPGGLQSVVTKSRTRLSDRTMTTRKTQNPKFGCSEQRCCKIRETKPRRLGKGKRQTTTGDGDFHSGLLTTDGKTIQKIRKIEKSPGTP